MTPLERELSLRFPELPLKVIKRLRNLETRNRQRAKKKGCNTEKVDFIQILCNQRWLCHICGEPMNWSVVPPAPRSISYEHDIALGRGGHHTTENSVGAHLECNLRKNQAEDTRMAAKVRRLRGETGQQKRCAERKTSGKPPLIKSRGFQGHRKFNGEIKWKT